MREFNSTLSGSPVLSGTAGAMLAVLDYVLVQQLGWTKSNVNTNVAVYTGANANAMSLYVDDTGTLSSRVIGYEDVAGSALFPTSAQTSGGFHFAKSTVASTAARAWMIHASSSAFYLTVDPALTTLPRAHEAGSSRSRTSFFGKVTPLNSSDTWSTVLIADSSNGSGSGAVNDLGSVNLTMSTLRARSARSVDGTLLSDAISISAPTIETVSGLTAGAFPSPRHGGATLTRMCVHDSVGNVRGFLPDLFFVHENQPFYAFARVTTPTNRMFRLLQNAGTGSRFAIEI